jgi:hypothetical protein
MFDCDEPEVLIGEISFWSLTDHSYEKKTIVNNSVTSWHINGSATNKYKLGLAATVTSASYLVADLNGGEALSLSEINMYYSHLVDQYCQGQTVTNITYVDPNNPTIKTTAAMIQHQAGTNNSFVLAKELFIWLKENTEYHPHLGQETVQPAHKTLQLKTGDCDDLSLLYLALCRSRNIPARIIRGILVEEDSRVLTAVYHAWVEVFVGETMGKKGWIPVECACPCTDIDVQVHQNFGVETAGHIRLFQGDGSNQSLAASMSGPRVKYDSDMDVIMKPFIRIDSYEILEKKQLFVDGELIRYYI